MAAKDHEVAAAIAQQIENEQGRVAARMSWNLTFQGFMIASYALIVAADEYQKARTKILLVIAVAGIAVAIATFAGVFAAGEQSSYLKAHWKKLDLDSTNYPRPFSEGRMSKFGRAPTWILSFTIIFMWLYLFVATLFGWLAF